MKRTISTKTFPKHSPYLNYDQTSYPPDAALLFTSSLKVTVKLTYTDLIDIFQFWYYLIYLILYI